MAGTLDSALAGLFGGRVVTPLDEPEPPLAVADSSPRSPSGVTADALPANVAELTRRARDHYDRARAAQRSDDWATYGAEMRKLGEVLRQLEQRR